ncbi:MAG: SusD/RagB family nutrient-binding outer membrane lipoprotein [Cytophagaceae bacterium]|nr:SusD/RagB family nutrient-binding outer membrane lipoprotein [Cytophagaceae bacterium]MBK9509996.1 SusD/RagB family nutrient-binding outer membrane lipoprotein [Cytophagaceae bacterium]MBL0302700.1 SusD/RagB family nutrient-binding outer membrane lipoprotein [Cytophagaceae bacterium]MBL0325523.1 SusD/RagB family nutrient-binding outer membrane lipoprotein [Cytophagaceae bacterium]
MKKLLIIATLSFGLVVTSCQKSDFEDAYTDPSKISQSTVEKQFAGFIYTTRETVIPSYWNYFVINRITVNRYSQVVGWVNSENQYVPGSAAVGDRWTNFYKGLAQFREIEKIYAGLTDVEKKDRRIYIIAATTFLYDQLHKVVDLHGDIPFSEAGMLSAKGGDYLNANPKYDTAEAIYTKMLDDLKTFSDELNSISVIPGIMAGFKTQDLINNGDLTLWKKYVNSLRLRLLTRVSGSSTLGARSKTEIGAILADPTKYPVVTKYDENIQIDIFNLGSQINSTGFRTGLEDWDGNVAGKVMIDKMVASSDPRLDVIFEKGQAATEHVGLDPLGLPSNQQVLVTDGKVSRYNRSTISRNEYFPGVLITASEVDYLKAEYYLNNGNDAAAKTSYESGIKNSISFYKKMREISNDNTTPSVAETTPEKLLNDSPESWGKATSNAAKMALIAGQRWIHFNVVQPTENWAEIRRTDLPSLTFWTDNAGTQKTVPSRWQYPGNETTYNVANYETVKSKDNLNTKIFWDLK